MPRKKPYKPKPYERPTLIVKIERWEYMFSMHQPRDEFDTPVIDHMEFACCIEATDYKKFNSGDKINMSIYFDHRSRAKYPDRKIFSEQTSFGMMHRGGEWGYSICLLDMPIAMMDRLSFLISQGINPSFIFYCEREKRQLPLITGFELVSEVKISDYF